MLRFICKKLVKPSRNQPTTTTQIHSLESPSLKSNSKSKNSLPPSSSLIQCLMDSYGLSQETALLTAKKVEFRTPKDLNKIPFFFKTIGFSKAHIGKIVAKRPEILFSKPESTLRPKIRFFQQMGISDSDLIELLASQPAIFLCSLEKNIKPSFDLFRTLLGADHSVFQVVRHYCTFFYKNFKKTLIPNAILLKNSGVPDSRISKFLRTRPRSLLVGSDRFKESVETVKAMGFDPSTNLFLEAVIATMNKSVWNAKFEVYKSFGWSDDEVMRAFRNNPNCFTISEKKIRKGLNFFMKELGWNPRMIFCHPSLLSYSLEKTIVPRYGVLQVLLSRGLVKKSNQQPNFIMSKKMFLETYVTKYQEKVPEVLKAFNGEIEFVRSEIEDEEVCVVQQL